MAQQEFRDVRVIVAGSDPTVVASINSALFFHGIRDIAECGSEDYLIQMLEEKIVDVLLCDMDSITIDFIELTRGIRQGAIGKNPFVFVIGLADSVDSGQMPDILKSGMDSVMHKPVDSEAMTSRIYGLTRKRKPFVVSDDYVGPTRRKESRPGEEQNMMDVPNTLHSKVVDGAYPGRIDDIIVQARHDVEELKDANRLKAILALANEALVQFRTHTNEPDLRRTLDRLIEKCARFAELQTRNNASHVSEIVQSIGQITARMAFRAMDPKPADITLLELLALTVGKCVSETDASADTVREIANTVLKSVAQSTAS